VTEYRRAKRVRAIVERGRGGRAVAYRVSATPVRKHIEELRADMTLRDIAEASGVSIGAVHRCLTAKRSSVLTAEAILAVPTRP
jgi:hypothetical protein